MFWKCIVWLSQLFATMSELAVLVEWAFTVVYEMLAHLGLVLLLQSVELALISVEVVIVALLGKVSHHFAWWIVEVLLLAVGAEFAFLEFGLWLAG